MDENKMLKPIDPVLLSDNFFKLIGEDWMLITAGKPGDFNAMTASWGGIGILWGRKVCFCFVRPTRYTFEFMEKTDQFTLCFFSEEFREVLNYFGSYSGRDVDKVGGAGLTPVSDDDGCVYFDEARIVLKCRKLYIHDFDPSGFLDPEIDRNYPAKDYHRMYIGEITACLAE